MWEEGGEDGRLEEVGHKVFGRRDVLGMRDMYASPRTGVVLHMQASISLRRMGEQWAH